MNEGDLTVACRLLKNNLECRGLTPLSIGPANHIREITKDYACDQSGVKPPHPKIFAAPLLN